MVVFVVVVIAVLDADDDVFVAVEQVIQQFISFLGYHLCASLSLSLSQIFLSHYTSQLRLPQVRVDLVQLECKATTRGQEVEKKSN